jgi:hypothetical protein
MAFPEEKVKEYDHLDVKKEMGKRNRTQKGDPEKGRKRMYEFTVMENPPLRVVIRPDAYEGVFGKLKQYEENYESHEKVVK